MARKRKEDEYKSYNGGGVGYSKQALEALNRGTYGKEIGSQRKAQYHTSQEQVQQSRSLPKLEGMTRSNDFESSFGRKNNVDTTSARKKYEQKIGHTPIGKALTEKDVNILYNGALRMRNNNMTASEAVEDMKKGDYNTAAGMMTGYIRNKDWKKEYGKSLEELVEEYSKNGDAINRHTEKVAKSGGAVSKTVGSILMNGLIKPMAGARATVQGLIDPDSKKAKNANTMARLYSDMSKIAREDVTKDMSGAGKTVYDVGTSVADRVLPFLLPGGKAIGSAGTLFRTAEDKRESLEDRGITGRGAIGQSLASGGIDAALDVVGLEKIKGLSALKESGSLAKAALGSAAIGGGEQFITSAVNEAIDRVANGKDSVYSTNVANYIKQGMPEDEAKTQALIDEAQTIGQETAQGAAFGAVMGTGGKAIRKAADKIPLLRKADTTDIDTVIDNAVKQSEEATTNIRKAAEQIPEVPEQAKVEQPNKIMNESVSQNPRLVKALEGDELKKAKSDRAGINKQIGALKNTIELQEQNVKNAKIKKERAYETKKLNEMKNQLADLQTQRKGIDRQIKGEPTPIIETLTPEERKQVSDFKAEVRKVGNMWAGSEGKELAKRVNAALDKYIETGSDEDLREYAMELWHLHESATGEYTSKAGNTSRYSDYNDDEYNLFTKGISGLDPIFSKSRDMNGVTVGQPKVEGVPEEPPVADNGGSVPPETPPVPPEGGNNPPETSLSRRYETLKYSDLFQKSEANMRMLESAKESGVFNKDIESRTKARNEAVEEFLADPDKATERNLNRQWDSGKDVDTSMLILHDALDSDSQVYTNLVLLKQAQQAKKAGRQLRAYRDYTGTKEATVQKAGQYLNDKADEILSSKKVSDQFKKMAERIVKGDLSDLNERFDMDDFNINNIREALEKGAGKEDIVKMIAMYQAVGKTGISPEALQKISDIYDKINEGNLNPNSRERANLETDAFKVLADDIGGKRTWKEQWNAWRYLAMLGNPKTHLRNILGNTTHRMVTEAKDTLGAVLEGAVDKTNKALGGEGIDRTKAILTPKDKGLVDIAAKDADDVSYAALNDSGNKYNVKSEIDRARDSFNNKVLSKIDDLNSNALDIEDYTALKNKYSKSLARFLKANGADESIFNATDDASKALLDKGRAYAIDQAKQATFHEYSAMAEALTQFSQKLQGGNAASKTGGMILEGLLPFKKTPINILKQGVKYSPVSLAKSVKTMADAVRTGNKSASDAIEDLAAGLTGTGIMALGGFLAHEGLLTGAANDNYDVDTAETEQGAQNYALKIGNKSYTLDWLAPMALPLFVGAELMKMGGDEDDGKDKIDQFIGAISTIAEPITEMSMLQGIQNILNELSYSTENVLATFGTNATLGYASQGIPTIAGQFARAIDDTRRSTYTDQPAGFKRQFDKTLTKIENKLPFLSKTNEPYVNASGQEQQNEGLASHFLGNNFVTRLADQMLSPGYFKNGTISDVDKELNRLYDATGENVYKNVASGKIGDSKISKEAFTKYQELYGGNNDKLYNAIIGSPEYNAMDDSQKVDLIGDIKKFSKLIADHEVGGKDITSNSDQKKYDIYKEQGIDGVIQYLKDSAKAKALDLSYDTYTKKEAEQPGSAAQYAQDSAKAKELGISVKTYQKQQAENPNGAEGYVNDMEAAKSYGFVKKDGSANMDAYYNGVDYAGSDPQSLKAYAEYRAQGFKKNNERVPYLMNDTALTDEQKGRIIGGLNPDKMGKGAKGMYDLGGYDAVWSYYVLKDLADTDGNGRVSKAESKAILESDNPYVTSIPDDQYYFLAGTLYK